MADDTFDVNRYALSLEIQLNTDAAFNSMDMLGERAEQLERKITNAAQESLNSITSAVDALSVAMAGVYEQFNLNLTTSKQIVPVIMKQQDIYDEIHDRLTEEEKGRKKGHDDEMKTIEALETINKAWKTQGELVFKFFGELDKIVDTIGKKNDGHKEETSLIKEENGQIRQMSQGVEHIGDAWSRGHSIIRGLMRELRMLANVQRMVNNDVENFVTANYRAYGSQQEVVLQTAQLTRETALLREETLATYKILGNLRIPAEQMRDYAETIGMTTRYTGVGIEQLSAYIMRIRSTGLGSQDATRQLAWMGEAMRKLGLSTADMNSAMQNTGATANMMSTMFIHGKDSAQMFDRMKLSAMGMGKAMGMTEEEVAALARTIETTTDPNNTTMMSNWANAAGLSTDSIRNVKDYAKAFEGIGRLINEEMLLYGEGSNEANVALMQLANQYKITTREAEIFRKLYKDGAAGDQFVKNFMKMDLSLSDHDKSLAQMKQAYAVSIDTMVRRLKQMGDKFEAIFAKVQFVAEAFIGPILDYVVYPMVWVFGAVIDTVFGMANAFDDAMKAMLGFGGIAKFVLGAIILLPPAVLAVMGAMRLWHNTFGALTGTARTVTGTIGRFGHFFVNVFSTVGQAFRAFLTPVADGLRVLGAAVQPFVGGLLALGAAFLMVGAGAYAFAKAVAVVAQLGLNGVGAMAALAGSLSLIGIGLVALAGPATAVAPGLFAVGAALLMVGGAAWLFGAGMQMAATAAWSIVQAIGPNSPPLWIKLGMVATALGVFTAVAAFGVGPILGVGAGFAMLAGGVWVVVQAFKLVASAFTPVMNFLTSIASKLPDVTTSFQSMAVKLGSAAFALVAFSLIVAPAVPGILSLGFAMGVVGTASLALGGGAWLLSQAFTAVFKAISDAGAGFSYVSANILKLSAGLLPFMGVLTLMASTAPFLIAPLLGLGSAITLIGIGVAAIGSGFWLATQAMKIFVGSALQLGSSVGKMAIDLAGVAVAALPLGAALVFLSFIAGSVAAPIALLGLALIPLGAGIWLTAQAVRVIGEMSDGAVGKLSAFGVSLLGLAGGMVAVVGAVSLFALSLGVLSAIGLSVFGPLFAMGGALAVVGAGAYVAGLGLSLVASAFKSIADSGPVMASAASGLASFNALTASAWSSVPAIIVATTVWARFASVFKDISTNLSGVSEKMRDVVASVTSTGTKIGSAFRHAAEGSVDLSSVMKNASGISVVFTKLSESADKIEGIQRTAANIDVAMRRLAESGGRLRGIKDVFAEFSTSLTYLVDSVSSDVVIKMTGVSATFSSFATSLNSLADSFIKASAALSIGMPEIDLTLVTDGMTRFADSFDRMTTMLSSTNLAKIMDTHSAALHASIEDMAGLLNKYADLLENAASRVEIAIASRAIPALTRAKTDVVGDLVKAETISTVKVKNEERVSTTADTSVTDAVYSLAELLSQVITILTQNGTSGDAGRTEIAGILSTYLPDIATGRQGSLASDMNNWVH